MREAIIQQIARQYGLPDTVVLSTEKGYRNESHPLLLADGRRANIIVYKNEPGILQKIRTANQTANFLAARGFPARRGAGRQLFSYDTEQLGDAPGLREATACAMRRISVEDFRKLA